MLSFPTQTISARAVQVAGDLDSDEKVWLEADHKPLEGLRVTGRLSGAGQGRFYFSGKFAGKALGECRRCLVEVISEVEAEVHLLYADDDSEIDGDPDVFPLSIGRMGEAVDLRPAVRESWLLEVPALVLCRPDCKGLCLTCGANLNLGACSCAAKPTE